MSSPLHTDVRLILLSPQDNCLIAAARLEAGTEVEIEGERVTLSKAIDLGHKVARGALAKIRKLVPGAIEMVYDNYNWLVVGFGPSERPSEAIFSIVMPPGRVTLCFLQGAGLPDPAKRLMGSGNVVRNIRLYDAGHPDARVLDDPEVLSLINVALNRAKVPMPPDARRELIIKSISAKQRPRRRSSDRK